MTSEMASRPSVKINFLTNCSLKKATRSVLFFFFFLPFFVPNWHSDSISYSISKTNYMTMFESKINVMIVFIGIIDLAVAYVDSLPEKCIQLFYWLRALSLGIMRWHILRLLCMNYALKRREFNQIIQISIPFEMFTVHQHFSTYSRWPLCFRFTKFHDYWMSFVLKWTQPDIWFSIVLNILLFCIYYLLKGWYSKHLLDCPHPSCCSETKQIICLLGYWVNVRLATKVFYVCMSSFHSKTAWSI